MNEVIKNAIEIDHDLEFDQAVTGKKIDVLNTLVAADVSAGTKRVGLTDLELRSMTPTPEWPVLQQTLDQLAHDGIIHQVGYTPYEVGVFVGYELVDDIPASLPFVGSAGGMIKQRLEQLEKRMSKQGIGSLIAEEWALLPILRAAHQQGISGMEHTVDLAHIHRTLLDDLSDEGVEKWHLAFAGAVKQAQIFFQGQN